MKKLKPHLRESRSGGVDFFPKVVVEEVATTSLAELATTSFLTALHKMSWTATHADYD